MEITKFHTFKKKDYGAGHNKISLDRSTNMLNKAYLLTYQGNFCRAALYCVDYNEFKNRGLLLILSFLNFIRITKTRVNLRTIDALKMKASSVYYGSLTWQ